MADKTQIMEMINGIKGNLAELESALGAEGEVEPQAQETAEEKAPMMENSETETEQKEEMPPMLKKFIRG